MQAGELLVGGEVSTATRRARRPRGGSRRRRRAPPRSSPSCRRRRGRSASRRRSALERRRGPRVGRAGRDRVEVAVPSERAAAARPVGPRARAGRPRRGPSRAASPSRPGSAGDLGGFVLGAAGVLRGRRDQRAREPKRPPRGRRRRGRVGGGGARRIGLRHARTLPGRPAAAFGRRAPTMPDGDAGGIVERRCARASTPIPDPWSRPGTVRPRCSPCVIETPEPALLFTERSAELHRHPGEVSFPGGLREPGRRRPASDRAAGDRGGDRAGPRAPRGARGAAAVHTVVSSIVVSPFVAAVGGLAAAVARSEDEIARILTVPIRVAGRRRGAARAGPRRGGGAGPAGPTAVAGATIWGATGAMLHDLIELLRTETRVDPVNA